MFRVASSSAAPAGVSVRRQALNLARAPREPRRVVFLLDGPEPRQCLLQQILWMRLEGLSLTGIARAIGVHRETVQAAIDCWQSQTELALGERTFTPLLVCPRREAGRKKKKVRVFSGSAYTAGCLPVPPL